MHMHISSPSPSTYSYDTNKVRTSHTPHHPATHVLSPGQSPYDVALPQNWTSGRAPQLGNIPLPDDPRNQRSHGGGSPGFQIHPALVYNPSGVIYFNLAYPTETIRFKRSTQQHQLSDPATYPSIPRLLIRIYNQSLQVDLPIQVENQHGLTLYDVLHQIYLALQAGISRHEMAALQPHQRSHLSESFARRTANKPDDYRAGLKRLDWLGQNTLFLGLSPATDGSGSWFINFGSQPTA